MIRDPSDGSVREKPVLDTATTGLAPAVTPQQAEERARITEAATLYRGYCRDHRESLASTR
mgnify:CR=1 FL=1